MDVSAWLEELGLAGYAALFAENRVDADVLADLTDADLEKLGVPLGDRKRLLKAIAAVSPGTVERSPADSPQAEAPAAQRRQLTVMFCDLVGSTALSGALDPEDYREVMRSYQEACAAAVGRYDGHVAKYLGDGVLAYFGYPRAHEDDAERAVRAGLAIVETLSRLKPREGLALEARVGIATGLVVVGDILGAGVAEQGAVSGETPNLAARLQALAAPGTVVVSESTRRLLQGVFEWEDLGAHRLKGFADPVSVARVAGESSFESRFDAAQAGHLTGFVGREHELALLEERWTRAREGEGQVVLLSGEAGIGKSRITRALLDRAADDPHTRLRYQCSPHHANSAFYPFITQIERAAGFAADDDDTKLDKLEALLRQGLDDIGDSVPLFAALLTLPTGDRYRPLELAPQPQKQRTQGALLRQLEGLAERQPVLLVFEDLHWADPTTLEVLEQLVDRVLAWPVLAVITYRAEFQPAWTRRSHTTTLSLNRLGRRQGAAIVAELTDGKAMPEEVLDQILEKTDGVPLFVEELTKTSGPLPSFAIPNTLHDSLIARLDHLAPVKAIAQTGAVIGREFPHKLLAAVAGPPEDELDEALGQLVESELIFRRGAPPDATYVFKHALVRDAAYGSLLKSQRQELHARIFRVIEEDFPNLAETEPELLAHHATNAGLIAAATDHWLRAGQREAAQSANIEAIGHLRTGLDLLETLPEDDHRDRLELSYLIALGPALMATAGWDADEVDRSYSRARLLARKTEQPAVLFPAVWGLWLVAHAGGMADRARTLHEEMAELARAEGDETLILQAHHAGGSMMCSEGYLHEAQQFIESGIAIYKREKHEDQALRYGGHDPCVCAQSVGALNQLMLGNLDAAERYSQGAMALAEHVAHRPSVAHAHSYRAELCHVRGQPKEAGQRASTVLEIAESFGLAHYAAWARMLIGWSRAVQGEINEGLDEVNRGLADLKAVGIRYHLPHRLAVWVETLAAAGAIAEAAQAAEDCLAAVEETGERWYEPEALRLKARVMSLAEPKNLEERESLLARAVAVADEFDARFWKLRAAIPLAGLWRDQGKTAESHELLAPIHAWFTEGLDAPDLADAKALLDRLS
jgi:predicted ATPase/class 3 adenylate cyclase